MARGMEMEYKRFGGYNPKMSQEMAMSSQPQQMELEIEGMAAEDEDIFSQLAPTGNFSKKAMNQLVKATNRLLPLFGQDPTYPEFGEDVQQFPTDFVRVLAMFQGAVNAAVDSESIEPDMDFMMEDISDDRGIVLLAGRLNQLSTDRGFKQFLKNPPQEMEEEDMMAMDEEDNNMNEMDDEEVNKLMASRI